MDNIFKLRVTFIIFCFFIFLSVAVSAQVDTLFKSQDTILQPAAKISNIYKQLLDSNFYLRSANTPVSLPVVIKKKENESAFFYIILFLLLFLGIIKTSYSRYFNTLFRVFFNTSLRQNQLTDQLEQAKLPSLIFNVFFTIVTGLYISILLHYFILNETRPDWYLTAVSIAGVAICYIVKYLSLKCTGWVTTYTTEANVYIFIIFLLNKIIGILLLPFVILILFSTAKVAAYTVFISIIALCVLLLLRFFRSYSLLQNKLSISRFHFFLYIICVEIMPLALIYKLAMVFLGINT